MENKRKYILDFYEVKIGERNGVISVQYLEAENFYFCKFLNDKHSDFINTYNSFGFYVDKTGTNTKFRVSGKFTEADALSVWDQIERENKPIETTFIMIKI